MTPTTSELLLELADAVDKDRGHDSSLLTRTMREAATRLDKAESEAERLRKAVAGHVRDAERRRSENAALRAALKRARELLADAETEKIERGTALERERSVITSAKGLLQAYRAASVADEEGLASHEDWRAAWDDCDTAASEFESALSSRAAPEGGTDD